MRRPRRPRAGRKVARAVDSSSVARPPCPISNHRFLPTGQQLPTHQGLAQGGPAAASTPFKRFSPELMRALATISLIRSGHPFIPRAGRSERSPSSNGQRRQLLCLRSQQIIRESARTRIPAGDASHFKSHLPHPTLSGALNILAPSNLEASSGNGEPFTPNRPAPAPSHSPDRLAIHPRGRLTPHPINSSPPQRLSLCHPPHCAS